MKRIFRHIILAAALVAGIAIAARVSYRARHDLVTLNVRRMDLREVVRKIEWQTWETVLVQTNVQGPVTLNVRNMPLAEVLELVAEQTGARSSIVYPLYSSSKNLVALKKILRGEGSSNPGWTNWQGNGGPRFFGGARPPEPVADTNRLFSLRIVARDLQFTTLALNRLANIRVVPEDGMAATVSLTLDNDTAEDAVEALARKTHHKWAQLFTLRKEFGPGGPGGRGPGGPPSMAGGEPNRRGPRPSNAEAPSEQSEERRAEREVLNEQLLATLPAEEREKMEQAQADRQKEFLEMQSLTPEQRREYMMQRGASGPDRALERLKNSSPEQRAAQRRQMALRPPGQRPQFSRQ